MCGEVRPDYKVQMSHAFIVEQTQNVSVTL